ncbi:MAG: hypothetical protein FWD42_07015 [Solirubrobacterales bacterium]|nr:hypothetical protein [Solirubrobacterales bacterium]
MSYTLRRLPLSRLLALIALLVAIGIGTTKLALAVGAGPTPPPKPLAEAVHGALTAPAVPGVSARIQLTNQLLEGANLTQAGGGASGGGGGGGLASSPLVTGASGRLWISKDGRARLELQSEKGDTEILYDGHTVSLYEPTSNTLYRYTPEQHAGEATPGGADSGDTSGHREAPSVAKIEEALAHASKHANISPAVPTDVAGQAAYTVSVSPREHGGLIGGAQLSFDAVHGVPLRAAIYAKGSSAPVVELAATDISYEPVPDSVFEMAPPPGAKIDEIGKGSSSSAGSGGASGGTGGASSSGGTSSSGSAGSSSSAGSSGGSGSATSGTGSKPHVTTHGQGLESIVLVESPVKAGSGGSSSSSSMEGLQKMDINGASARELATPLGTLLSFERAGTRYLLAGSVTPASIETFARSL